jgi:hypothetical protein
MKSVEMKHYVSDLLGRRQRYKLDCRSSRRSKKRSSDGAEQVSVDVEGAAVAVGVIVIILVVVAMTAGVMGSVATLVSVGRCNRGERLTFVIGNMRWSSSIIVTLIND